MFKYLNLLPISLLVLSLAHPATPTYAQTNTNRAVSNRPIAPRQYTGTVKQVDDIAQQITVRIEAKTGNGSGVIIARSGNTYTILTAAHVVKEPASYAVITPTQEKIVVKASQIEILNKDLDIAIVKFTSAQNYRVAEIANYQFTGVDWVFVSGFPGSDRTRRRHLNLGVIFERDDTAFQVKEQYSLSNGNNLIYTNLSLPGMSGGAVLDRRGRLVGINTGAENERIINQNNYREEEINFGYALGIPTSTILGVLNQGQKTTRWQATTTIPARLTAKDEAEISQNQLSALAAPSQTSTAKDWLDYGNLLWRSRQNQPAIIAFDRAISLLTKQNARKDLDKEQLKLAYFGKGSALGVMERYPEAAAAYQQALAVDPNFLLAWRYQGLVLKRAGQIDRSLISYQKAIALDPQNFVLYVEQAGVLSDLKRYPAAIASYSKAIQIQPKHPWAYANRGLVYQQKLNQYPQALADFSQAIKLNPQLAECYAYRGLIYLQLKKYPQALADYNNSIAFKPQYPLAFIGRGRVYQDLKKYPQALADFSSAIKIAPRFQLAHVGRARIYDELKQYPQALTDYSSAIKIAPQDASAYSSRGNIYRELKKFPPALIDYNQAIALDPQSASAYIGRGRVYLEQVQYAKAKIDWQTAAKLYQQQQDRTGYRVAIELLTILY